MPLTEPFDEHTDRYEAWFETYEHAYESEIEALDEAARTTRKDTEEDSRTTRTDLGQGVEIGVGSGRFAAPLGLPLGIDPSERMLTFA
jgi:hypothetical protein